MLVVEGAAPVGRMRKEGMHYVGGGGGGACRQDEEGRHAYFGTKFEKTWQSTLSADIRLLNVDPKDVHGRKKWRVIARRKTNPAASGTLT